MARIPTGEFSLHRTGCYGCVRSSPADGACGIVAHPCVHLGDDLFAVSPEVFAPEGGTVTDVSNGLFAPFKGYGPGVIMIQGDSGFFHLLAHLVPSSIVVTSGQRVEEGDLLAKFDPGIAHTHWEVRKERTGPADTNTIDPIGAWIPSQQRSQPEQTAGGQGQSRSAFGRVAFGRGFGPAAFAAPTAFSAPFIVPAGGSAAEGEGATQSIAEPVSTGGRIAFGVVMLATAAAVGVGIWHAVKAARTGGR